MNNLILIALLVAVVLIILSLPVTGSGPGCPGMDPQWLGFCGEGDQ